ncbi:MAG: pyrimidine dimer DNA glycosylase/endonuclease V [Elusimicrobiota bacterium]
MNIFVLDLEPEKCAVYHCDKHVVKMLLESAQMLSTAVRMSGINKGYKACYQNHPCTKWVRKSVDNWLWLRDLVFALNAEWKDRFDHLYNHKSFEVVKKLPVPNIKDIGLTPFALAMPEGYKQKDAVSSYRNYYMGDKRHIAKWRNGKPWWWK